MSQRARTILIRQFIVDHVSTHPRDIAVLTMQRFKISRQAVNRHLRAMEASGVLRSDGRTRSRAYRLGELHRVDLTLKVSGLHEDVPWQEDILPGLSETPQNILQICSYGFTEMLNNVIDHSGSEMVCIECVRTAECIDLKIMDFGIGIFKKIKDAFSLRDELEAITELAKGKLTTDPDHHTGEGIFFTSRMFDFFHILSGHLYFSHTRPKDDWLIEDRSESRPGTYIRMMISLKSETRIQSVFDEFASSEGDYEFSKTHVPVKLMQYGAENLVSRSQAKRLLSRFDTFKEIILDFEGVEMIGQAFADEIFRVYQNEHPNLRLIPTNAGPNVGRMIARAVANRQRQSNAESSKVE